MKRYLLFLGCVMLLLLLGNTAWAELATKGQLTPELALSSCPRLEGPLVFCGEAVPLQYIEVRERLDKELLLLLGDRAQLILWMKRARRYLPIIEEELRREGLPDDLKYIVVIESGMLPHAGSSRGAVGFWQFIPETGRTYGLTISESIDERRSIFASTAAAVRYLKKLYGDFHCWTLAAAAYNMGEAGLQTQILVQKTSDFYQLYLPLETQQYVPRIVLVKLILSNPARFGFDLKQDDLYPPLAFTHITLQCDDEAPVMLAAEAAHTTFKAIKDLNPEIRGYWLPKGRTPLLVPPGEATGFQEHFDALYEKWRQERKLNLYEVCPGDTLSGIAARFNVPVAALLIWNRIEYGHKLVPGERIVVYRQAQK